MGSTFFVPSDVLPGLLRLTHRTPSAAESFRIPRLRVVVDANSALRELYWIHRTRQNPAARSQFREVVDAGVIIPYAPPQLDQEVVAQFDYFHEYHGIPLDMLQRSWNDYRALIKWVCPRPNPRHSRRLLGIAKRHPKDVPYVALAIQIGAAGILTRDPDFECSDVRSYDDAIILALRTHARSAATELAAVAGGSAALSLGVGLVQHAWRTYRRLPPPIQLGLAILGVGGLAYASKRRRDGRCSPQQIDTFAPFADFVGSAFRLLGAASAAKIQHPVSDLANVRPLALVDFAAVVCAEAPTPVPLADLVRRAMAEGYRTRSRMPHVYLRRLLRQDPRFFQASRNRWTMKPVSAAT